MVQLRLLTKILKRSYKRWQSPTRTGMRGCFPYQGSDSLFENHEGCRFKWRRLDPDPTWSAELNWRKEAYCCLPWLDVSKTDDQGFQQKGQALSISSRWLGDKTHHFTTRWPQRKMDSHLWRAICCQESFLWRCHNSDYHGWRMLYPKIFPPILLNICSLRPLTCSGMPKSWPDKLSPKARNLQTTLYL